VEKGDLNEEVCLIIIRKKICFRLDICSSA
jgi:hypothetical protein